MQVKVIRVIRYFMCVFYILSEWFIEAAHEAFKYFKRSRIRAETKAKIHFLIREHSNVTSGCARKLVNDACW